MKVTTVNRGYQGLETGLAEQLNMKFEADAFNLFSHRSLDTPNADFELNSCFSPVPCNNLSPNPPNAEGLRRRFKYNRE